MMTRREAARLIGGTAAGLLVPIGPAPAEAKAESSAMLTRIIPSSREDLPVIGLGTWQAFDVNLTADIRKQLEGVLSLFVKLGGRVIDSSPMYGRAEDVVGALVEEEGLRSTLFLATKVWTSGRESGIAQMEASFRKLRTERLDLMQVHNLVDVHTHLATMREWQRAGRIRYIGVTHYTRSAYSAVEEVLNREPVEFLQINYSVHERDAEKRLLPMAHEKGIAVLVNRPFAEGALMRRLSARPLPDFAAEIDCTSWAQLLLKFVISHPAITWAIPATSNASHVRDNLAAANGRMPDAALRERIASAATG